MPTEEIPTKYCNRIKSQVYAEDLRDITNDKVFVVCKHYDSGSFGINKFPCIKNAPIKSKCLVESLIKREASRLVREVK